MITRDTLVRRSAQIVDARMGAETVMFSIQSGVYYTLDPIAGRVWELLAEPMRVSRLLDMLGAEFEMESDVAACDTLEFLERLARHDLIDASDAPAV
jgi:hypothetical protein